MSDSSTTEATTRVGRAPAALGVIGSLVFVGLEIPQNTAAIRAQARWAMWGMLRFVEAFEAEYGFR